MAKSQPGDKMKRLGLSAASRGWGRGGRGDEAGPVVAWSRGLPALLLDEHLPSSGFWGPLGRSPGICSFTQMPSICL